MRILTIETSGRLGSVALLEIEGDRTIVAAERRTPDGERTARSLLPAIQELLREHAWRPADVNLVCVTTGPGSFTGLRIGVVAAKTFAYAIGARLVGVHTLAAMAAGVETRGPERLWTVLDAQRQELFVASFGGRPLIDQAAPETEILPVADWFARLALGDLVAGPPLAKCRDQLPAGVIVADERFWEPSALPVGRLGYELFKRGGDMNPLELVPHYYRKSAAEEKAAKS
ncbi:MAG: tRNA (adenosine(37)-N6)-threonylcarbamoyltransferase complex dimerization subunit type 1 TsaB [Pirellulales bacterium]|nr:tRNA (adenosine(37)-N6)-threonylcarbamoyltransferase complex dimerization subunit type 1 TsaB [Pirellulales bacterium]